MQVSPKNYYHTYAHSLCAGAAKLQEKWNALISSAAEAENKEINDMLVNVLVDNKPTVKTLNNLESLLKGPHANYFKLFANSALEIAKEQKHESKSRGLFGFLKRGK